MARRDATLPSLRDSISSHYLGETRKRIIGLIAMTVNIAVEFFSEGKGVMHVFHAHIACPFVVRDTTNKIAAQFHRFTHQLASIGKRENPILGKGNQLQV